jgi:hypothetical protein
MSQYESAAAVNVRLDKESSMGSSIKGCGGEPIA